MASKSGISINWGGLEKTVNKGTANIANTKQLMLAIGVAMKAQTVRRFHEGVSPEGEAWKPSARTKEQEKAKTKRDSKGRFLQGSGQKGKKGSGKTLLDTGRLRSSISFSGTALEVHVGSGLEYARIHQLGGKAGRGRKVTIPARPYLGLSVDDQKEIEGLVQDHMEGSFE